jgi:formylglycine-generating enzyme required for sulfatase activity
MWKVYLMKHQVRGLKSSVAFAIFVLGLGSVAQAETKMVLISGGSFLMGSDNSLVDERPSHKVTVQSFFLDRTEVTNAQLAEYLNKHGHKGPKGERYFDLGDSDARIKRQKDGRYVPFEGHDHMPVVEVSWLGARNYCDQLGKRLPTEAEWEFAARGPEGRTYPWGNEPPNKTRAHFGHPWGEMAPVDTYPKGATPEGILGLAGNVHEWTSSASEAYPYKADDAREEMNYYADRVTRGAAHDSPVDETISTWRGQTVSRNPMAGHHGIGFRCARSADVIGLN